MGKKRVARHIPRTVPVKGTNKKRLGDEVKLVPRSQVTPYEKLTVKQRRFVRALLDDPDMDERKAALEAGYAKSTASMQAGALMRNKKIRKVIEAEMAERNKISAITGEQIIKEISDIAFLDPVDLFYEKNGQLHVKSLNDLTPIQRKLIDKVEVKTESKVVKGKAVTVSNVTVSSITSEVKLKALTLLMKHKGMLVEKSQQEHVHTVNWDDYYKARQDDLDRKSKQEESDKFVSGYLGHVESAENEMRDGMYGTLYEGSEAPIDTDYTVKEMLDTLDDPE